MPSRKIAPHSTAGTAQARPDISVKTSAGLDFNIEQLPTETVTDGAVGYLLIPTTSLGQNR
jgi:hypothetical protein